MKPQVLLLTGGTGSLGQAYVRFALSRRNAWQRIIVFSDTESNQSRMKGEFPASPQLEYFLGNVRDEKRLTEAMNANVTHVIHAAAMKEVETCEYDWSEAAATNIDGSANVTRAALRAKVQHCLLVSTDKAVAPVTPYGITKAAAEQWFIRANRGYGHAHRTKFSVVRYGNVLGSRGSVLHKVGRDGRIPITDPQMTRYWWTLNQACRFVHHALKMNQPGDIAVPRIRAASVLSLFEAVRGTSISQKDLNVIGIRGIEKLHEDLITGDELRHTYAAPWAYIVQPANPSWQRAKRNATPSRLLPSFNSASAPQLSIEELRAMLEGTV